MTCAAIFNEFDIVCFFPVRLSLISVEFSVPNTRKQDCQERACYRAATSNNGIPGCSSTYNFLFDPFLRPHLGLSGTRGFGGLTQLAVLSTGIIFMTQVLSSDI